MNLKKHLLFFEKKTRFETIIFLEASGWCWINVLKTPKDIKRQGLTT
jgi:hypothetical protein